MWLCSSAALGSAPLAARLGPPGTLSPACTFWQGAGMQTAGAVLIALAPGARDAEVPESRNQVTGGQLWAGLAAGPRVQGSERRLEGPASSGSVNSAPRAETTCPASLALPVIFLLILLLPRPPRWSESRTRLCAGMESAVSSLLFSCTGPCPGTAAHQASLPIPSLWVFPVHQPQASSIMHRTWTGNSFHT